MIPVLTAPTKPNGLPTAIASSPWRKASESPCAAARSSSAWTCNNAMSRFPSRFKTWAVTCRPFQRSTCVRPSRSTCAFVTTCPSVFQITPDPLLAPLVCTWTVERRSRSVTSPKALSTILLSPSGPLADADLQLVNCSNTQHTDVQSVTDCRTIQYFRQCLRILECFICSPEQYVTHNQAAGCSRAVRIQSQEHDSTLLVDLKLFLQIARKRHRLDCNSKEAMAHISFLVQFLRNAIDGATRHGQHRGARQPGGDQADNIAARIHCGAAGRRWVYRDVQPDKWIESATAP